MNPHLVRPAVVLAATCCLVALSFAPRGFAQEAKFADPAAVESITAEDLRARLAALADDAMKGRDTRTGGNDLAADYLVETMKAIGLEPGGVDGTYVQPFEREGRGGGEPLDFQNVLGLVEGTGPEPRPVVILSAHYDHIGIAGDEAQEDRVYNGADDNASGVSTILELGEAFAKQPPACDVLVIAFDGEEQGLLGSRHFAEEPTVPLDRVVAVFNYEMVGRPAPEGAGKFWVTGFERSSLGAILDEAAEAMGSDSGPDPFPGQNFFRRSDNFPLAQKGVIAHTCSSFDPRVHRDYHQVSDELETIDFEHMESVARATYAAARAVAEGRVEPEWAPDDPFAPANAGK